MPPKQSMSASSRGQEDEKSKPRKKKVKLPAEDEEAKARLNLMQMQEELRHLQRLTEENIALKQVSDELGNTLLIQVNEKASITKDIDDELNRADLQLTEWTRNRSDLVRQIEFLDRAHANDMSQIREAHARTVQKLNQDLRVQQKLYDANSDLRLEKRQLYAALETTEKEAVAARKHHQSTLSECEHACLLEKALLKRDMLFKIHSTKRGLLDAIESQLTTCTQQVIVEKQQLDAESSYQSSVTAALLDRNNTLTARWQNVCRSVELGVDALGLTAYKEDNIQRQIRKVTNRLSVLQSIAMRGDLDEYRQLASLSSVNACQLGGVKTKPWGMNVDYLARHRGMTSLHTTNTPRNITPRAFNHTNPSTPRNSDSGENGNTNHNSFGGGSGSARLDPVLYRFPSVPVIREDKRERDQVILPSIRGSSEGPVGPGAAVNPARLPPSVGRVKELEEEIQTCAMLCDDLLKRTGDVRTVSAKVQLNSNRVLALQDESMNLIDLIMIDVKEKLLMDAADIEVDDVSVVDDEEVDDDDTHVPEVVLEVETAATVDVHTPEHDVDDNSVDNKGSPRSGDESEDEEEVDDVSSSLDAYFKGITSNRSDTVTDTVSQTSQNTHTHTHTPSGYGVLNTSSIASTEDAVTVRVAQQLHTKATQGKLRVSTQSSSQPSLLSRHSDNQHNVRSTSVLNSLSRSSNNNNNTNNGIRWSANNGIPPVLSKVAPQDAEVLLALLYHKLDIVPDTDE